MLLFILAISYGVTLDYIPTTATPPSKRGNLVIDYSPSANALLVFSGGGNNEKKNDLWEFNFTSNLWREVVTISQYLPGKSYLAERINSGGFCSHFGAYFYIFGGNSNYGFMNDMWVYDIYALTWEVINTVNVPQARYRYGYTSYVRGLNEYFAVFGGSYIYGEDNNLYM